MIKPFKIVLFILLLSLPLNVANSEILKFEGGSYEGEVKKGKAYGVGKYTTKSGEVFEGKWRHNRLKQKNQKSYYTNI